MRKIFLETFQYLCNLFNKLLLSLGVLVVSTQIHITGVHEHIQVALLLQKPQLLIHTLNQYIKHIHDFLVPIFSTRTDMLYNSGKFLATLLPSLQGTFAFSFDDQ